MAGRWKARCSMKTRAVATVGLMVVLASGLAAQDQSPTPAEKQNPSKDVVTTTPLTSTVPAPDLNTPAGPDPAASPGAPNQSAPGEPAQAAPPQDSDGANPGDSHVRIVRLSQAHGHLLLDRGTGKPEQTMQNMPIVQGSRLITSEGYAEIEFEDGSTLRVTPNTEVDFPQLLLRSTGVKANTVRLVKGTLYADIEKTKDNEFTVKSGDAVLQIQPATHTRIEMDGKKTSVSVFQGKVEMQAGAATTSVEKKHTATFDTSSSTGNVEVAKKISDAPFDEWDKNAIDYHDHYAKANAFSGSPYSYGISDLNYYGGFVNAAGCGSMWRPYFAGSGWDPYGNGVWAWYQGAGYSWVSPYPWGWLPYHSGAWSFCPGTGWGWRPGGAWIGLANAIPISRPVLDKPGTPTQNVVRGGMPLRPPGPSRPGVTPKSTLVLSNRTPMVYSHMDNPGSFVFQKNSAGMGVPRGSLGNLHSVSNHVEHNGFANREVYVQPLSRGTEIRPGTPLTLHSAPRGWASQNIPANAGLPQRGVNNNQGGSFHGGAPAPNGSQGSFHNNGGAGMGSSGGFHNGASGNLGSGAGGGFHGGAGAGGGGGGMQGGGGHSGSSSSGGHR